jgi:hypothetical protein
MPHLPPEVVNWLQAILDWEQEHAVWAKDSLVSVVDWAKQDPILVGIGVAGFLVIVVIFLAICEHRALVAEARQLPLLTPTERVTLEFIRDYGTAPAEPLAWAKASGYAQAAVKGRYMLTAEGHDALFDGDARRRVDRGLRAEGGLSRAPRHQINGFSSDNGEAEKEAPPPGPRQKKYDAEPDEKQSHAGRRQHHGNPRHVP